MTQKKIKASDVIGNSYYIYTLTSTNNTPSLNDTINITCTVTNIYGQAVSNKTITLYQNTTSKGEKTTLSNGTATWNSIIMSSAGLQVFRVENTKIEVFVYNKSDVGHTHTQYLTSSDISGKANTNDLGAVAFSNDYDDLDNKPNIPSNITVDTTLSTTSNNAIANSTVKNALDNKLDKTHTSYKGKNVVTNASTGTIEFEEKNNHTHSQYLTSHQDISNKIDTAGTGLSKTGTTLNHSNNVTALTTASLKKVKYDSQGHITETTDVSASDLPTHSHSGYQETLVSGTNLKTVNNESLLGSGNITVQGGSNVDIVTAWESTPSDSKVASEKLTKDTLDTKIAKSSTTGLLKNDGSVMASGTGSSNWAVGNHTHGNLSNDGKVGSNSNYFVVTTTNGAITSKQKIGDITINGTYDNIYPSTFAQDTQGVDRILFADASQNDIISACEYLPSYVIKDSNAHSNLGTSANASQSTINTAIDTLIGQAISYINQ